LGEQFPFTFFQRVHRLELPCLSWFR
jgi:hypothetical protein